MRLTRWTPAPLLGQVQSFETLREVTAEVDRPLPVESTARQVMRASHLHCQKGGHELTGGQCMDCARIVSIRPSPGKSYVTVRCLWTEADVVDDVMTLAPAVVTVRSTDTVGHAHQVATRAHVHHLLVADDEQVVGVVCPCALAPAGTPAGEQRVAEVMDPEVFTVPRRTSLASVAEAMERLEVGIVMIAEDDKLIGIVTLRDLGLAEPSQGHDA